MSTGPRESSASTAFRSARPEHPDGPDESPPVPTTGCDHVALAVPDLEAACEALSIRFGLKAGPPKEVPAQGIRIAYVDLGNLKLELMEPTDENSAVARFLAKRPRGGLHHIALSTPDAHAAHAAAISGNLATVGGVSRGHHGRNLFFLRPDETLGALIEIEEEARGQGGT